MKTKLDHFFRRRDNAILQVGNEEKMEKLFDNFFEQIQGEIDNKDERGSGWFFKRLYTFYINTARFQALKGGTWVQMAPKPKAKTAILNLKK